MEVQQGRGGGGGGGRGEAAVGEGPAPRQGGGVTITTLATLEWGSQSFMLSQRMRCLTGFSRGVRRDRWMQLGRSRYLGTNQCPGQGGHPFSRDANFQSFLRGANLVEAGCLKISLSQAQEVQ